MLPYHGNPNNAIFFSSFFSRDCQSPGFVRWAVIYVRRSHPLPIRPHSAHSPHKKPPCVAHQPRRLAFVWLAVIYVRHPPPFCVGSTWVLCAFFETPLTTTKPTTCQFYTKPPENQPIDPFSPISPIRPINSHHSHPSHPSFFFHSPRCHRVPLRPLPGHSMPAVPRDLVPVLSVCLRPYGLPRANAFSPVPSSVCHGFPAIQSPPRP